MSARREAPRPSTLRGSAALLEELEELEPVVEDEPLEPDPEPAAELPLTTGAVVREAVAAAPLPLNSTAMVVG